ncbi:DMATS family aromatic prenyltransferase [Rugosimonospora acidiphila]|uniref:DMATS family aromatic prenyltransferase n=1 Tax=Rugosimonospora acidiphila TaxID=556531 RepID=A0ABP9SEF4_9ACTN
METNLDPALSLSELLDRQLVYLCELVDTDSRPARALLTDLLGPSALRPLSRPPAWPSSVADDGTPVEFSIAFNENERPTLRVLGEALAPVPSGAANLSAARRFVRARAAEFGLPLSRFERVHEVFAAADPPNGFGIWQSLAFGPGRRPEFKVYFNPEIRGVDEAPGLVTEAMERLGLGPSCRAVRQRATRPGELGRLDRLAFFALDLHDGPHARVKVYLSHHDAQARDVVAAAGAVDGIDPDEVAEFCALAGGGTETFARRPLVGSYTFLGGARGPAGYSVYVPIRSYVDHDAEAYDRVSALLSRYGFDASVLERAIAGLTRRPLHAGVGLIAHVSLRLGPPRPGVTVYLSTEAYRVFPPRRPMAVGEPGRGEPRPLCANRSESE